MRINAPDVTAAAHESSLRNLDAVPARVTRLESGMKTVTGLTASVDLLSSRASGVEQAVGPLRAMERSCRITSSA